MPLRLRSGRHRTEATRAFSMKRCLGTAEAESQNLF